MFDNIDLPAVAYEGMNAMHREEGDLIGGLLIRLKESEAREVTAALEALMSHMRAHFDYEENLLKNRGFAMFDIHRSDHRRILGETEMAYMNWRNFKDKETLRVFIEEDFLGWLRLHIQAMDSVAADFLVKRGADS